MSSSAGEVACSGVNGANRLASNSLLEGLVYGARAAYAAVRYAGSDPASGRGVPSEFETKRAMLEDADKLRSSLRRLMWGKVGLVRTGDSLAAAVAQLSRWERLVTRSFHSRKDLEVKNMVQVARCIAEAALWRAHSIGAHYRADGAHTTAPARKDHSVVSLGNPVKGSGRSRGRQGAATSARRKI